MGDQGTELRPQRLSEYTGQVKAKLNLSLAITAAKNRGEQLDHVLLYGGPGLGKTTLANVIANEMMAHFHYTVAPAMKNKMDVVGLLLKLQERDVLFVDEIHRLPIEFEEMLYSAMEDYRLDLVVGGGAQAKTQQIALVNFTLIGATTAPGLLTAPLRARFGISEKLIDYTTEQLETIIERSAGIMGSSINPAAVLEIASRCRYTPRVANTLLRRSRDLAQVEGTGEITLDTARQTMQNMGIDGMGLDETDRKLLRIIIDSYHGGPVGVKTLAAALAEDAESIEQVYEPYLVQQGLLSRTPRGRMATMLAYEHLGVDTIPEGLR